MAGDEVHYWGLFEMNKGLTHLHQTSEDEPQALPEVQFGHVGAAREAVALVCVQREGDEHKGDERAAPHRPRQRLHELKGHAVSITQQY